PSSRHGRPTLGAPYLEHQHPERLLLEIGVACDKRSQPDAGAWPEKIVLALQLLGFDLFGRGIAPRWTEPGPPLSDGWHRFKLPSNGNQLDVRLCTRADVARAIALAHKLPDGAVRNPGNRREIVLHRFLLGAAEESNADALVDFTIALEGFLLPPAKDGE